MYWLQWLKWFTHTHSPVLMRLTDYGSPSQLPTSAPSVLGRGLILSSVVVVVVVVYSSGWRSPSIFLFVASKFVPLSHGSLLHPRLPSGTRNLFFSHEPLVLQWVWRRIRLLRCLKSKNRLVFDTPNLKWCHSVSRAGLQGAVTSQTFMSRPLKPAVLRSFESFCNIFGLMCFFFSPLWEKTVRNRKFK